jgi:phospholipid/cholesterol/gamma-HCH transport system substrate-binding protein
MINALHTTLTNLKTGSKKLVEIKIAAKHNFLYSSFFLKQEKGKAKKIKELKNLNTL